jgi:hypothetical protein
MKMRLAGLRFVIRGHLHIHVLPGVGSRYHPFPLFFVGLDLSDAPHYLKQNKNPRRYWPLDHGIQYLFSFKGNSANRRVCRGTTQNKKIDGLLASPLDCHKTAKIMSYEDTS